MLYSPLWLIWLLASDQGGRVSLLFREVVTRRPRYLDQSQLVDTITSYRQRFSDYPWPWPPVIGALSRSPFGCISGTSYRLCAKAQSLLTRPDDDPREAAGSKSRGRITCIFCRIGAVCLRRDRPPPGESRQTVRSFCAKTHAHVFTPWRRFGVRVPPVQSLGARINDCSIGRSGKCK
jgi:hypothetical protein